MENKYNKILTSQNNKIINDSVEAASYENNDTVYIDTDKMLSLYMDKLTPEEYDKFNHDEAENFLLDYAQKKLNKRKEDAEHKKKWEQSANAFYKRRAEKEHQMGKTKQKKPVKVSASNRARSHTRRKPRRRQ